MKKRSDCPISCTLDLLGDKWSFLILRDMMFDHKVTFGDFLDSAEKIATNILTDRLKNLEAGGIIFKHVVPGKARVGYSLTEKGISLLPLVVEYVKWGVAQGSFGDERMQANDAVKNPNLLIRKTREQLLLRLAKFR